MKPVLGFFDLFYVPGCGWTSVARILLFSFFCLGPYAGCTPETPGSYHPPYSLGLNAFGFGANASFGGYTVPVAVVEAPVTQPILKVPVGLSVSGESTATVPTVSGTVVTVPIIVDPTITSPVLAIPK